MLEPGVEENVCHLCENDPEKAAVAKLAARLASFIALCSHFDP